MERALRLVLLAGLAVSASAISPNATRSPADALVDTIDNALEMLEKQLDAKKMEKHEVLEQLQGSIDEAQEVVNKSKASMFLNRRSVIHHTDEAASLRLQLETEYARAVNKTVLAGWRSEVEDLEQEVVDRVEERKQIVGSVKKSAAMTGKVRDLLDAVEKSVHAHVLKKSGESDGLVPPKPAEASANAKAVTTDAEVDAAADAAVKKAAADADAAGKAEEAKAKGAKGAGGGTAATMLLSVAEARRALRRMDLGASAAAEADAVIQGLVAAAVSPGQYVSGDRIVSAMSQLVGLVKSRKVVEQAMIGSRLALNAQESETAKKKIAMYKTKIADAETLNAAVEKKVASIKARVSQCVVTVAQAKRAIVRAEERVQRSGKELAARKASRDTLKGQYDAVLANVQAEIQMGNFVRDLIVEKLRQLKDKINKSSSGAALASEGKPSGPADEEDAKKSAKDIAVPSMTGIEDRSKIATHRTSAAEAALGEEDAMAESKAAEAKLASLKMAGAPAADIAEAAAALDKAKAKEAEAAKVAEAARSESDKKFDSVGKATQKLNDAKQKEANLQSEQEAAAMAGDTVKSEKLKFQVDQAKKAITAQKDNLKTSKTAAVAKFAQDSLAAKVGADKALSESQKKLSDAMQTGDVSEMAKAQVAVKVAETEEKEAKKKADMADGRFPKAGPTSKTTVVVAPEANLVPDKDSNCANPEYWCRSAETMKECDATAEDCADMKKMKKIKADTDHDTGKDGAAAKDKAAQGEGEKLGCNMDTAHVWCATNSALAAACHVPAALCKKLVEAHKATADADIERAHDRAMEKNPERPGEQEVNSGLSGQGILDKATPKDGDPLQIVNAKNVVTPKINEDIRTAGASGAAGAAAGAAGAAGAADATPALRFKRVASGMTKVSAEARQGYDACMSAVGHEKGAAFCAGWLK